MIPMEVLVWFLGICIIILVTIIILQTCFDIPYYKYYKYRVLKKESGTEIKDNYVTVYYEIEVKNLLFWFKPSNDYFYKRKDKELDNNKNLRKTNYFKDKKNAIAYIEILKDLYYINYESDKIKKRRKKNKNVVYSE